MAHEITIQELSSRIQNVTVVEVLPPPFFAQGHLPSAKNIPLEGFEATARAALPDRDAEIVVYCASLTCQNSEIAGRKLGEMGYSRVRVYKGGKAEWQDAGLPLEKAA